MYLMRSILLLTASIMLIAAPTRLVGLFEAGSDRPVADVNILYMSGKKFHPQMLEDALISK